MTREQYYNEHILSIIKMRNVARRSLLELSFLYPITLFKSLQLIRRSSAGRFPQYCIQNGFHGISCTCCVVEKSDTRLNVTWVVAYHKESKHIPCSTLWWYYFCTKETREHVSVHRQQGIYQCQLWTSRFKHHHQILYHALMVLYYERQTRIQHPIKCYEMYFPVSVSWCLPLGALKSSYRCGQLNSSLPSTTYMRQWIVSALVQIMACRLLGTKPLSKTILGHCQLDP